MSIRTYINLVETALCESALAPEVAEFISRYPDTVSDDLPTAVQKLHQRWQETRSHFNWIIARLPDGRFFETPSRSWPSKFGLEVIGQGASTDFD